MDSTSRQNAIPVLLNSSCGALTEGLLREGGVIQIRCPYPSKLGSPLSHSCDWPPIPWGGRGRLWKSDGEASPCS